jgi:hypothetical protein
VRHATKLNNIHGTKMNHKFVIFGPSFYINKKTSRCDFVWALQI